MSYQCSVDNISLRSDMNNNNNNILVPHLTYSVEIHSLLVQQLKVYM